MSISTLTRSFKPRDFLRSSIRYFGSRTRPTEPEEVNPEIVDNESSGLAYDDGNSQDLIDELRNKSKLRPYHHKKLHKKGQSLSEDERQVMPLRILRKIYGEYGSASGINVGLLWPSKEELELQKEWERVAYPNDIHQMIEIHKKSEEQKENQILQRQEDLSHKVAKLEQWKQEVQDRVAKQLRLAQEAREKKERVMEEVRQMFGYRVDPKGDQFKEALEKRELEEKRAAKAARQLKKQQKLLENIKRMAQEGCKQTQDSSSGEILHGTSIIPGSEPPAKPMS